MYDEKNGRNTLFQISIENNNSLDHHIVNIDFNIKKKVNFKNNISIISVISVNILQFCLAYNLTVWDYT